MTFWNSLRRWVHSLRLPKAPEGFRWVVSEQGIAALLAPDTYAMHRERDDTVAIYPPGSDSGVTLRFSFHTDTLRRSFPSDGAMQFVRDAAIKGQLQLTELRDRVVAFESRDTQGPIGPAKVYYWQIGVGQLLVVSSATVWGQDKETVSIRDALAQMPRIVESLRLNAVKAIGPGS